MTAELGEAGRGGAELGEAELGEPGRSGPELGEAGRGETATGRGKTTWTTSQLRRNGLEICLHLRGGNPRDGKRVVKSKAICRK